MKQVSAKEFQQQTGKYQDLAQREPITITKHDRPSLVLLSFDDYQKLTARKQRAMNVSQLSDDDISALLASKVPEKFNHLNEELDS